MFLFCFFFSFVLFMLFFSQVSTPLMRILFTELPGTSQNSLCHISRFIPVVEVLCSAIHFLLLFLNLQWTWRHWFWFHFSQKVFSDVRFFFPEFGDMTEKDRDPWRWPRVQQGSQTYLHFPWFHVPTCICVVLLGDTEGAVLPPHWNVCLLPN